MSNALLENMQGQSAVSTGEEDVRQYLQQIRQYPLLTPEQERELAKRCAQEDEEAIRELVNANLRLVVSIAREYAGRGVPLLDLIQEGSIGLLAAAKKFDYTLNFRFSTYATKWIRRGITLCIQEHAGLIRIPKHTAEKIRKLMTAKNLLQQQTGREPEIRELASYTGISEKKAEEYLVLVPEVCSLDAHDDENGPFQWTVEDMQTPQPQEELIRRELKNILDSMMGSLTQRQQQVLRLHFGMEDGICHTLEDIGMQLGVSKERVRQIRQQAMDKLQKLGTGLGLEDFLT